MLEAANGDATKNETTSANGNESIELSELHKKTLQKLPPKMERRETFITSLNFKNDHFKFSAPIASAVGSPGPDDIVLSDHASGSSSRPRTVSRSRPRSKSMEKAAEPVAWRFINGFDNIYNDNKFEYLANELTHGDTKFDWKEFGIALEEEHAEFDMIDPEDIHRRRKETIEDDGNAGCDPNNTNIR